MLSIFKKTNCYFSTTCSFYLSVYYCQLFVCDVILASFSNFQLLQQTSGFTHSHKLSAENATSPVKSGFYRKRVDARQMKWIWMPVRVCFCLFLHIAHLKAAEQSHVSVQPSCWVWAASWRRGRGLEALLGFKIHTWSPSRACLAENFWPNSCSQRIAAGADGIEPRFWLTQRRRKKKNKQEDAISPLQPVFRPGRNDVQGKKHNSPLKESSSGAPQVIRVGGWERLA